MPYEVASEFIYDYDLTGRHFTPLRNIIRAMCIDSHEEMKAAWAALIDAGFSALRRLRNSTRFHRSAMRLLCPILK